MDKWLLMHYVPMYRVKKKVTHQIKFCFSLKSIRGPVHKILHIVGKMQRLWVQTFTWDFL